MLGLEGLAAIEEYNNQGALLGLDGPEGDQLIGAIRRISDPVKRQRAVNKLTSMGGASKGSRGEMEKFFGELPVYIKESLVKGELRLADTMVYSIKPVNSKTIKLWETQDDKEVGLRNISNAKLPKNQALLVSGIILLAATAADSSKDKIISADYKGLENYPAILNGEYNLKYNKKQIVPETSNHVFRTGNYHNVPLGYYKLSNPRLIIDDVLIELTIELGSTDGIPANTYVYAALHGTITTP